WIHVLLPALLAALRTLGDAPARSLTALAQRLGVTEADVATVVTPLEEEEALGGADPAATPASPLLPMTGPNDASSAPKTLLHRKRVIAARKKTTRGKMPSSSMPCWKEKKLKRQEKKPHGEKCPARQCPAPHPLPERHLRRPRP